MVSFRFKKSAAKDMPPAGQGREYTIDELARTANTTVRNVRAYQDRGLLAPPEKRGRVGFYNEDHLSRLKLIGQMLGRGYTLGNIQEMLDAIDKGYDLRQLLGLTHAITSPWTDETPKNFNPVHLASMFGTNLSRGALARTIELGLLEPDGLKYRAPSPKILHAGSEMARAGIPLVDLLELIASLRSHLESFCDQAVSLFVKELDQYGDKLPPKDELPRLAQLIWKIRPLAMTAIESEVSRALQKSASKFVDDRIVGLLDKMAEAMPGSMGIGPIADESQEQGPDIPKDA
ncbi:MAG TPA: MerR family transcriptional regulator [Limnobacter sp.]|nr:MerR family transcriptional regulator [Limnobacter sp.]